MTDKQRELARHALGLPNRKNMSYRNHFCIPAGDENYPDWEDLVSKGLAVKASGGDGWCGDFFYLTLQGAKVALLPKEHICREDAARMRSIPQKEAKS